MQDYIPQKIDINEKIGDITVKQYDHLSRFLHIRFLDKDLGADVPLNLVGCEARLFLRPKNADGGGVYFDGDIADDENGIVTFLLPGSVTQQKGLYECEIRLTNAAEGSLISTKRFGLTVEESIIDDASLAASGEYSALENALFQVSLGNARIDNLMASANPSDTELIDLRTAYDGTPYATAGSAVRAQINDLYVSRRAATTAEFMAAMGETYADNDAVQAVLSDLQDVLRQADTFETNIRLHERMLQNIAACIPDEGIQRDKLAPALRLPLPMVIHVPYKTDIVGQGDCTIFQCGEQLIMVDCSNAPQRIIDYCVNHHLTKFTAFIGSHYHVDHMGGFEDVVGSDSLDFSECTFYLPATPDYSQCHDRGGDQSYGMTMTGMRAREEAVLTWLDEHSYHYVQPDSNTTTVFNDSLSIRWLNNDPQEWESNGYYAATVNPSGSDTGNTVINNFSLCCDICHGTNHLLWTGDISLEAQAAIVPYLKDIPLEVLKVQHHNVNVSDDADYVAAVNPSVMIVEGSGTDVYYPTVAKGHATGARVYYENWCQGDMLFYSDGYAVTAIGDTEAASPFGIPLTNGQDLNDLTREGVYYRLNSNIAVAHAPSEVISGFRLECKRVTSHDIRMLQVLYLNATPSRFYMRYHGSDGWGNWYRYSGEAVD